MADIDFDEIEVVAEDGEVMVTLSYEGEGLSGDYSPDDPNDEPLLRVTVYRKFHEELNAVKVVDVCDADAYEDGDWMNVRDGSFCTNLSAKSPRDQLEQAAKLVLNRCESVVRALERNKRLLESLSWVELKDGQPNIPENES